MNTREPDPGPGWGRTANDVFKSRSKRRQGWSLVVAMGLHAMLLVWSPTWARESPPDPASVEGFGTEVLVLQGDFGSSGGIIPGAIVVGEPEENPTGEDAEDTEEEDGEEPGDGSGEGPGDFGLPEWSLASAYEARGSDALRAELARRAQPVPTLVEPEIEPEAPEGSVAGDAASEEGEGSARIGGTYSLSEYDPLTEDELLALERLSALRPELAFASRSRWVLVRNPSEMEDFLRERFAGPGEGFVSVAIWVNERGSVEWAEIRRSSGRQDLDQSALELFQDVIAFRPARQGGVNVPMAMVLAVPFPW